MILLALCLSGCSNTQTNELLLKSDYNITALLDPHNRTLEYTVQVKITNTGKGRTDELYFHLYSNLYRTDSEGINVVSVIDESGNSISFTMQDSDQLINLTLRNALKGGEEITLIFTCIVTIPEMISIYGIARDGEIHLPFFYPQLSVFNKNGWNTKPLAQHGDGRYSAMSDYIITITAPCEYEIVCNGVEISRETQSGQTTYVFQSDQRRDIIIAAFTDYVRLERAVGNTRILGFFNNRNDNLSDFEIIMDAAAFSMEFFNQIYMVYPYETLIVMNSPWVRVPVSMEYSGLFTVGAWGGADTEETTYHEMAHQWFYFIVGNNENTEPWLDESFATFSAKLCIEAALNDEAYNTLWDRESYEMSWELIERMSDLTGGAINVGYDDTDRPFDLFYNRGAAFLKELMDAIGEDEFLSILSEYCKTFAFRFATTEDFISLLRERTPVDVEGIIDEYIISSN
jgi:hypothetical protein